MILIWLASRALKINKISLQSCPIGLRYIINGSKAHDITSHFSYPRAPLAPENRLEPPGASLKQSELQLLQISTQDINNDRVFLNIEYFVDDYSKSLCLTFYHELAISYVS